MCFVRRPGLEFEQKLTELWLIELNAELKAQRLESEGISRADQAAAINNFFDNLLERGAAAGAKA